MRPLAALLVPAGLIAAALAGCVNERPERSPGADLVQVDELPEVYRRVLEAYGQGGEVWELMRAEVRADPELLTFTVENLVIEMVRAHDALTGTEPARARRALDRSRAELVRLAPGSTPTLVQLLAVGDGVVARLCGEVLVEIREDVAVRVASLLDEGKPETRRRAAVLLADLPHAASREPAVAGRLARHALDDPEWFVRAEAARTVGVRGNRARDTRPARGVLERVLADPDPVVAEYAAVGLRELDDPRAVPALAGALERAVERGEAGVLREALSTLKSLTGEGRDLDPNGWRAWWREHGVELVGRPE